MSRTNEKFHSDPDRLAKILPVVMKDIVEQAEQHRRVRTGPGDL